MSVAGRGIATLRLGRVRIVFCDESMMEPLPGASTTSPAGAAHAVTAACPVQVGAREAATAVLEALEAQLPARVAQLELQVKHSHVWGKCDDYHFDLGITISNTTKRQHPFVVKERHQTGTAYGLHGQVSRTGVNRVTLFCVRGNCAWGTQFKY